MLRFVFVVNALVAGTTWAAAGAIESCALTCMDITRSSFINRA
ncbi:hypothetical protein [Bradyrhizobium sp. LMG 9283]